jgi:hypothetical protein
MARRNGRIDYASLILIISSFQHIFISAVFSPPILLRFIGFISLNAAISPCWLKVLAISPFTAHELARHARHYHYYAHASLAIAEYFISPH